MIVNKVEKNENFTIVDNGYLNDENLSFKAKGILTYLLSLPGDWVIYFEEVIRHSKDGIKSFRSGFDELIKEGYIKRYPIRENGVIIRWETEVYEKKQEPYDQKEKVALEEIDKKEIHNERLINTKNINTDSSNNLNNYNGFLPITDSWNSLGNLVIPVENIHTNVKRTIGLTKLIEKYGEDVVINTIDKIKSSQFAQRFTISFDYFIDEENFLRVKNS